MTIDINNFLGIPISVISAILPVSFATQRTLPSGSNDGDGKCELIGTFSLITQAFLGLLCLSSLIIKRSYEYPIRRTWPVWLFDVLKQLIGALGVHIFNVLLSIIKTTPDVLSVRKISSVVASVVSSTFNPTSSNPSVPPPDEGTHDPCDWYFLNIVLDCTIGVYVLYLVFKGLNKLCTKYLHMTQIESGKYGPDPNNPSTMAFLKQLVVYFTSLMITKILLYGIVECFETQLLWFTSHVLLIWLDVYPDEFEIFIVMFVVPVFMNCLQLVLIDNFIQNQMWSSANKRLYNTHHNQPGETDSMLRGEFQAILDQEYLDEQDPKQAHLVSTIRGNSTTSTSSNGDTGKTNTLSNESSYGSFNNV